MYCPVLLDFKNLILPNTDKIELSSFELEDLTEATIGNSIYTIKIFPPVINNQLGIAPFSFSEIRIPKVEPYKNKLRLQLQPSIGYGKNACYRVEYWKHTPVYLPQGKKGRPSKEKCRVEYWRVPSADRSYILNYEMWQSSKLRFNSSNIEVVSFTKDAETSSQTLENNLDIISIIQITNLGIPFTDFTFTDTSLIDYENPLVSLDWGVTAVNGEYQVQYIKPIQHSDLIYQDLSTAVLPANTLPVNNLTVPYFNPYYF